MSFWRARTEEPGPSSLMLQNARDATTTTWWLSLCQADRSVFAEHPIKNKSLEIHYSRKSFPKLDRHNRGDFGECASPEALHPPISARGAALAPPFPGARSAQNAPLVVAVRTPINPQSRRAELAACPAVTAPARQQPTCTTAAHQAPWDPGPPKP